MHEGLPPVDELPWTISYVIRKRAQIDSYLELPKEKRPPDWMVWYGTNEDLDIWFDKVFERNKRKGGAKQDEFIIQIPETDIG